VKQTENERKTAHGSQSRHAIAIFSHPKRVNVSFLLFFLNCTFYYDKLSRYATILSAGYKEKGREIERRRESRLPTRAFRQIEFAGAKASG